MLKYKDTTMKRYRSTGSGAPAGRIETVCLISAALRRSAGAKPRKPWSA